MSNTIKDIGGKAAGLYQLKEKGFNVPSFITITHTELVAIIENPTLLEDKLFQKFGALNCKFAVRSSATVEDGKENSYAGVFESQLQVSRTDILSVLRKLSEHTSSKRVEIYRTEKGSSEEMKLSFIIQEMVNADFSGVAFSHHPVTLEDVSVLNITGGLGDKLVSGEVTGDQIIIDNKTRKITENKSNLSESNISKVFKALRAIKYELGFAVDIEFAFDGDRLHLLQARPITSNAKIEKEKIVWDNSNIIESYPGITKPLTFSFIKHMYDVVYTQFAKLLGTGDKIIDENKEVYANMLGHLDGRVYYNLRSWYKALSMVPGYHINAQYMEKMMGVKESFELEDAHVLSKTTASFLMMKCVAKLIVAFVFLKRTSRKFLNFSNRIIDEQKIKSYDTMTSQQLMTEYYNFEGVLSKKWDAPLINDFFAMISFGLLENMLKKNTSNSSIVINDLLVGSNDIISVLPMKESLRIAKVIQTNPSYKELFQLDEKIILNQLDEEKYKELKQEIDEFISTYGERCPEELKLETRTYVQSPQNFIALLKSYLNVSFKSKEQQKNEQTNLGMIDDLKCGFFKKWMLKKLVKKTRYLVSNRENLRFQRTRAYGIIRRIFDGLGKRFQIEGTIDQQMDIYYLTKEEIFDYIKGTSSDINLKAIIKRRKVEYARYDQNTLPSRITTYGTVNTSQFENDNHSEIKTDLSGIGCCAGVVKSRVTIVTDPTQIEDLNNTILIAKYTDPGWIRLFPSVSAIIVERGSLLSHSAIVARELGIPCIVGVEGATTTLKTGDLIIMNGSTGSIEIVQNHAKAA